MDANERKKQIEAEVDAWAKDNFPMSFNDQERSMVRAIGIYMAYWADSHPPSPESELVEALHAALSRTEVFKTTSGSVEMMGDKEVKSIRQALARLSRKKDEVRVPREFTFGFGITPGVTSNYWELMAGPEGEVGEVIHLIEKPQGGE